MTLPPFPYILTIEVYNEAGEKVRVLAETRISDRMNPDVLLVLNGIETNDWNRTFNPAEGSLKIRIPNLETPEQRENGFIEFEWDGYNNNGQEIGNGVYYIKFTTQDGFGHSDVVIKDVMLVKSEQYTRVTIYNSAGEIVRRMENANIPLSNVKLNVDDVLYVGKDSKIVEIGYAEGQSIIWDGLNSQGQMVSSGTYEIQVEVKTEQGYKVIASKTVSIISEGKGEVLGYTKIYPNPYKLSNALSKAKIEWKNSGRGTVDIRIYNINGDLVRKIRTDLDKGIAEWDLKTSAGTMVSNGVYVIIIEGKKETGEREIKKLKFSIIRATPQNSDRIN